MVPVPGILKSGNLSLAVFAALVLEKHVVATVRVERRVKIHEVYALVGEILSEDREVVTIEKRVCR